MKIAYFVIGLGVLGLVDCCSNSERYLPYHRGCLSKAYFLRGRLLSDRIKLIDARAKTFLSLISLLDFMFESDRCFLNFGENSIITRASCARQATVYVHVQSPLPLSGEAFREWIQSPNECALPTIAEALAKIPFSAVDKIEWYDANSSGVWVPKTQ